jgi:hypothetical protein
MIAPDFTGRGFWFVPAFGLVPLLYCTTPEKHQPRL